MIQARIRAKLLPLSSPEKWERVLVACSGGADSVALAALLRAGGEELRWRISLAHFNHASRGADSDNDEAFVRSLAANWGVPFIGGKMMAERGFSEGRAREARYAFLRDAATKHNARWVALGHNRDDVVETLLLNLLRGTGVAGLQGIPFLRDGVFIRPLLDVSRTEILSFLKRENLSYVEDHSNSDTRYLRNRIRHQLLPLLEREYNARTRDHLYQLAGTMAQVNDFLEGQAHAAGEKLSPMASNSADGACQNEAAIPVASIQALHPALRAKVLEKLATGGERRGGIYRSHLQALLRLTEGEEGSKEVCLPRAMIARREYGALRLGKGTRGGDDDRQATGIAAVALVLPSPHGGETFTTFGNKIFLARIASATEAHFDNPAIAFMDLERLAPPLLLRPWQVGDRMEPLGMPGKSRKIQDIFTDRKIPRKLRTSWPLLVDTERVLWVPTVVLSERARITIHTQAVLRLEIREKS